MQIFFVTLQQMLILFTLILIGLIFKRCQIIPQNSHTVIAKLENNLFMPALIFMTLIDKCTIKNLSARIPSLYYGISILIITVLLSGWISKLLAKDTYERQLYRYSVITPNYSFMGNAIALGVFGEDFLFEYIIFTIPLTIFTYAHGVNWLKSNDQRFSITQLFSPVFFAIILGIFIGICNLPLPGFVHSTLSSLSNCMSPLAMFLTGFIIGDYPLITLLKKGRIYILSLLRLIAIPAVTIGILRLLHAETSIIMCATCMLAMPLGLNTIIIPAAYEKDTRIGASMALISSALSVITIPILFLLV